MSTNIMLKDVMRELDVMIRGIRSPKLLDWFVVNVVKPSRHAEQLRLAWFRAFYSAHNGTSQLRTSSSAVQATAKH